MERDLNSYLGAAGNHLAGETIMKNVIVIPTHRTGTKFLDNLLVSFKGYNKYPILIVILDYRQSDREVFSSIISRFSKLPLSLETMETNSFELGGLYTAYKKTDYDEFLLLPHSCEIVNHNLFDIVFNEFAGRSAAFGVQAGNWNAFLGSGSHNEKYIFKYVDRTISNRLAKMGNIEFWHGHVGKYRREILNRMNLQYYLPTNMIEAISKSELLFTSTYHSLDEATVVLFRDWTDRNVFEHKFGKTRLKIINEYIIKWKSHWSPEMVFRDMNIELGLRYRAKRYARRQIAPVYRWIKGQIEAAGADSK